MRVCDICGETADRNLRVLIQSDAVTADEPERPAETVQVFGDACQDCLDKVRELHPSNPRELLRHLADELVDE
jgi:hypothetical protein